MTNFGNQQQEVSPIKDGNVEARKGLERKTSEIAFEELNAGDLFVDLHQEDMRLIDGALNLQGFELNEFVANFEFDASNEAKKKDIYNLSQDIYRAVDDEVKKRIAKELAKIISQLYN